MTIRFLHTADVHIDSPLTGLRAYPGAPVEAMRTATRRAFEGLVDTAIDERVAFVVIAGDLYDGAWKDFNTGLFFAAQMARLREAGVRAYVLHGNHDAESDIWRSRRLRLPDNVFVFESARPTTFEIPELKVALHGRSFPERAVTENLVRSYPEARPGWLNIGVLHTALSGRPGHEPYAPCELADLRSRGYAYWALGHVHQHDVVARDPWVVFPGNLQGRHARETGPRGAVIVEAEGDGIVDVRFFAADVARWAHLAVDVEGVDEVAEAVRRAEAALSAEVDRAEGRPLAARITLRGRTAAHGELFARQHEVREQLQETAIALGVDRAWIEKLRLETRPEWTDEELRERGDAVAELRAMLAQATSDLELVNELQRELGEVLAKLPDEVARASDDPLIAALREARVAEVIEEVAPALVARISEG